MPVIFSRGDKLEQGLYTVIKELGVGGMGVVYHCRDEQLMRDVAIKMLLPELMADKSSVEIFRQEARLAAQLEHPNIVTVFDFGVEDRQKRLHHYVSMEYLPGGNLANRVISGPLAVEHCLNWMKQLASGLTFAHKRGVVHQDIKADNIFITTEGDLKIGDFGLARLLVGRVQYNSATKGMGTPAYMSPELCRGEQQDHRSDIYSLGVLFFEMATGQLPYRARGMIEMATKHSSHPIPSAKRINPLIPEILDKVIRRMMAKTAEERYANMSEVLTILDDLIFELRVARLGLGNRPLLRAGPMSVDSQAQSGVGTSTHEASPLILPEPSWSRLSPKRMASASGQHKLAEIEALHNARTEHERDHLQSKPESETKSKSPLRKNSEFVATQHISHLSPDSLDPKTEKKHSPRASADQEITAAREPVLARSNTVENCPEAQVSIQEKAAVSLKTPLKLLWSFKSSGPVGWSSSPVLNKEGSILYFTSADACLYAIEAGSGEQLWKFKTSAPILTSPILSGDQLAVTNTAGEIFALSSTSGAKLWSLSTKEELLGTAALYKENLIIPSTSGCIRSVALSDGRQVWSYNAKAAVVSAPQSHSDLVFFGSKDGHLHAISSEQGEAVWNFPAHGSIVASPAASVDSVYFGTNEGTFYALEASNGALIWSYPTNQAIVSRAVIAFASVVFASHDRWLYSCEKYDGTLKWKGAIRGRAVANLISLRELVVTATPEGWLQAFSTKNGQLKWQTNFGKCIESAPLVVNEKMFLGTVEGEVFCFNIEAEAN